MVAHSRRNLHGRENLHQESRKRFPVVDSAFRFANHECAQLEMDWDISGKSPASAKNRTSV